MNTLTIPSFERRLLQTVREEIAAEPVRDWPEQSLHLCLDLLRKMCGNAADLRPVLEKVLADGVEARMFARVYSPLLPATDDYIAKIRELVERVAPAEDAASRSVAVELRLLEQESQTFRDLLAEALSRASEAPRAVDWDRVRAAEEAHVHGATKPFARR